MELYEFTIHQTIYSHLESYRKTLRFSRILRVQITIILIQNGRYLEIRENIHSSQQRNFDDCKIFTILNYVFASQGIMRPSLICNEINYAGYRILLEIILLESYISFRMEIFDLSYSKLLLS